MDHLIYIGTYTRTGSKGIYALRLDGATGALSAPVVAATTANPTWLTLSPDQRHLYAVCEGDAWAAAFALDVKTGRLTPDRADHAGNRPPCHLAVDHTGRCLLAAHYHAAAVAALPLLPDGSPGPASCVITHTGRGADPVRQASAHVHSVDVSPDNRFVIVCDLGLDRIFIYRLDPVRARLTPAPTPFIATAPGAGPRHTAFSPDGRFLFVIHELNSTVASHRYDAASGTLAPLDTRSTLPADFQGENTAAEIRVHPNGRFLYASNRGHDSIAVFAIDAASGRLALLEHTASGDQGPRCITLSPEGRWLVAAHENSDSLRVFRVDAATGRLAQVATSATVPQPVCVCFAS